MKRRRFLSWLGLGGPVSATIVLPGIRLEKDDGPKDYAPPIPEPEPLPEEAPELKICHDHKLFRKYLYINVNQKHINFTMPFGYDAVSANTLYSVIQNTFDEPGFMQYSIPISAQTRYQFSIINGWTLDESCLNKIANGSIVLTKEGLTGFHPGSHRSFMSLFSVGHCIKNVRCTWEILINGKVDRAGEFRTAGHFNELIEITGYDQDITTIKVTMDDGRCWENTYETHTIHLGSWMVPLCPNDTRWPQWEKDNRKWMKEKGLIK